jgi:putative ABC transport system substrate-binding protein
MKRRQFITLLGGAVAAWPVAGPLSARAQPAKGPIRIGMLPLGASANPYDQSLVEAFRRGLRQVGLIENRDIVLDVAWIAGDAEQAVDQLIARGAEILVPCGTSASVAARKRTVTIPIVFISVGNPIGIGLVESLSRPGHNATGFSDILADLGGKLVDIARELSKPHERVDYLWHTGWADGQHRLQGSEQPARSAGVPFRSHGIADIGEANDAIAEMKGGGAIAVVVQPSPFTYGQRGTLIASAMKHGLGTIFAFPVAAREGSLIAYGPDYVHMYRRAPLYVARVLKGILPADLPVEQPTKIELLVNLTTAKTLGLEVPLSLLVRADELIE